MEGFMGIGHGTTGVSIQNQIEVYHPYPTYTNETVYLHHHSYTIGLVLHELGHWIQWKWLGNDEIAAMLLGQRLLNESWANYVGWELCRAYYKSLGWREQFQDPTENVWDEIETPTPIGISYEARQNWQKTDRRKENGLYSPLFVDLRDGFNQRLNIGGDVYPDDVVNDLDYLIINELGKIANWPHFKQELRKYLSESDYNTFIADFDWWQAHH